MKITDIDKFSPEMQNPDITKPAGAGDVPLANYKMIGALAVKRGELDRKELANFTTEKGLTGWHRPRDISRQVYRISDLHVKISRKERSRTQ